MGLAGFCGVLCTPGRHQHRPGDGSHLTYPSNQPQQHMPGGNCPVVVKRKAQVVAVVCWVEQGPPAPCPGMCHQRGARRALCPGQGRHLTLVPLSLQPGNPLAFYFISYQHRNEPCSVLSFSGVPGSSGSRENTPKPPIWPFPRSAKEPLQGLLQKSTPKWQIWKHGFFTNLKAEACWYSMYLEGLKSHLPVFNYLTIQCFP